MKIITSLNHTRSCVLLMYDSIFDPHESEIMHLALTEQPWKLHQTTQEKYRMHIDKLRGRDGIKSEDYVEFYDSTSSKWCTTESMSLHHLPFTLLPQQGFLLQAHIRCVKCVWGGHAIHFQAISHIDFLPKFFMIIINFSPIPHHTTHPHIPRIMITNFFLLFNLTIYVKNQVIIHLSCYWRSCLHSLIIHPYWHCLGFSFSIPLNPSKLSTIPI